MTSHLNKLLQFYLDDEYKNGKQFYLLIYIYSQNNLEVLCKDHVQYGLKSNISHHHLLYYVCNEWVV